MVAQAAKLLEIAQSRVGCAYRMGADVPLADPNYKGDFDCAEYASWVVMQTTGRLVGATPGTNPDPYSGRWYDEGNVAQSLVPGPAGPIPATDFLRRATVADALRIPGAVLVRRPQTGAYGHVAIVGENDSTFEAYSSAPYPEGGVRTSRASGRRWDLGILVAGVEFIRKNPIPVATPSKVLRRGSTGEAVRELQRLLRIDVDGAFGKDTLAAVVAFQRANGLVPDGEVGDLTWAKLRAQG